MTKSKTKLFQYDEEDNVYQDWLEFKLDQFRNENNAVFINLKRSEISEVSQCMNDSTAKPDEKWTLVAMKNGHVFNVFMTYNKVMELL